jgi:3-keto-disaccharide hydrolase
MINRSAIMASVLFGVAVAATAEPIDFEGDAVGSPPKGWTATMTGKGMPRWTVERDDTAPSGNHVLKQSGAATYPLALKDGTSIQDGFVEVRFKAIAGTEDRAAGLVWRARDASTYYVARANALENNVVLYKTVGGVRSPLDIVGRKGGYGVNVPVAANQWHTLRVDYAGSRFKVTFNGAPVFEVEDGTITGSGMVGLWTKADSVTAFDGFAFAAGR